MRMISLSVWCLVVLGIYSEPVLAAKRAPKVPVRIFHRPQAYPQMHAQRPTAVHGAGLRAADRPDRHSR